MMGKLIHLDESREVEWTWDDLCRAFVAGFVCAVIVLLPVLLKIGASR